MCIFIELKHRDCLYFLGEILLTPILKGKARFILLFICLKAKKEKTALAVEIIILKTGPRQGF